VEALREVTLDVAPGAFVALIGPSGCGKSTLLRLIAGLECADCGGIFLDGERVTAPGSERGFVFQNHTLFPWLNVYGNIAFGLKARGVYRERKGEVKRFIQMVGLEGFEKSFPHQLSGGMCQRAALARALAVYPKVLLLDEPLGALDAFTRMNMQEELLKIRRENRMTTVMVTHDVDEAVYLADEVAVMSPTPGKIEKLIKVELARPRARSNPEFLRYRTRLLNLLNFGGRVEEPNYYI
jgi:sulfonate transport system ATP-binding protein